jgi:endonuclease III related protein
MLNADAGFRRLRAIVAVVKRRGRPSLRQIYRILFRRFGPSRWWPAETPFEVCLGAILTQNTAWTNVERVLVALRKRDLLSHRALFRLRESSLARLLRPSGTFQVKARRVRAFLEFLETTHGGVAERMAAEPTEKLRAALLAVHGIGPETADCIVLYAAGLPSFVVDAYTRRVFGRLGLLRGGESYDAVQRLFHDALPADAPLFNEYHAQIVRLAKECCRPRPLCASCPLDAVCAKVGVERP